MQYASTQDGSSLAFEVVGEGPIDIVLALGSIPLDSIWEEPDLAAAVDRLADVARIVLFDVRGFGASDALPGNRVLSPEESMQDLITVMDASGARSPFILRTDNIAPHILLASTMPERVAGLVLVNAYARLARAHDYPVGIPASVLDVFRQGASHNDRNGTFDLFCRPRLHDREFRQWFLKTLRRAASPKLLELDAELDFATDCRHLLPLVQVPALVLHSAANPYVRAGHGRYLAEHIPDARYAELPGDGHVLAAVDLDLLVDEVAEFVTGEPVPRRSDRVFATVLFSDIVASTEHAVEAGDMAWRRLLDRHDDVVNRQLTRFDGRLIKTTGDGIVATFTGPARAVGCAIALRDGLRRLGLDVRMGLHAGEVEKRGDDISGIAVHVAARVQALATGGEVLATRTVVDLVAGSGLDFTLRSEAAELKGVPGRWALHAVAM